MSKNRQKQTIIPPWEMPSDPVKAVFWFVQWLLKLLVRFFWIPIIVMILYEVYLNTKAGGWLNGGVSGVITLLVGSAVWGLLYVLLLFFRVSNTISKTISDVGRMQQTLNGGGRRPFYPFPPADKEPEGNVVEGTITDLEQERKKRRRE